MIRSARQSRRRRGAPVAGAVRAAGMAIIAVALGLAVNWLVQVVRKPSELLFPVADSLSKTPEATWRAYEPLFRRYSTRVIGPELLAALAQTEGSGNPAPHTYWRWAARPAPFDVYRPASSSVGMYQMTDGAFAEARQLCVRDHAVLEAASGAGRDPCGFGGYFRIIPRHAIELTAAYLDRQVSATLRREGIDRATLRQKQQLAAAIHLCGPGVGGAYARRGFRFAEGERCGDHDAGAYLAHVDALQMQFARLAGSLTPPRAPG